MYWSLQHSWRNGGKIEPSDRQRLSRPLLELLRNQHLDIEVFDPFLRLFLGYGFDVQQLPEEASNIRKHLVR